MILNKNTYKSMVDNIWNEDLSNEEKEDIVKSITGTGSHFNMNCYTKTMRADIRNKMVELNYVHSLTGMRAK